MTDEVVPAAEAAPEVVETASTPEVSGEAKPEEGKERVFTQAELDQAISKRLAREERKWQREQQRQVQPPAQESAPEKPDPEKYTTTEAYLEALTDWKAEQKVSEVFAKREKASKEATARQEVEQTVTAYQQKEEIAREKYEDYDDVALNPRLPITEAMARTIQESDNGPELAYFLGKNPQEAARIAKLSPFLQAKELGRIEAKLPEKVEPKKPSSAPEPLKPVNGKGGSQPVYDTTDPRSLRTMSTSEWIAAERERQRKKLQAQGYS